MAKFLVVEDDPVISQALIDWLRSEHHTAELAEDGVEASDMLRLYQYDIVILDWKLPRKSGLDICRDFRRQSGATPILMLTGESSIDNKETGLDAGADDYLTKPFQLRELAARVRALLRRPFGLTAETTPGSNLILDRKDYSITIQGEKTTLQPREFAVMEYLCRYPEQYHSTTQLLNQVWASDSDSTAQALKSCIMRIRQRTKRPGLIESSRNCGYRLRLDSVAKRDDSTANTDDEE
ncbi:MAG: response regulator transcription factor [Candidatus Obscuribacterales bacterium]|nr:response regulator transcription factor [Candidatus Obscuribacterales bacterium]